MGFLGRLFGPNIDRLEERGDIDGLVQVLDSGPSADLRLAAVEALANLPEERSITALVNVLGATESLVSDASEAALRRLGPTASASLVCALATDAGDRALVLLLDLGDEAIEPLRGAVQSPSDQTRRLALSGIRELDRRLGEPEVREVTFRTLLAALGDRSADCRVDAATGLGELADPRAGRALAAQLKDGDADVRVACGRALGGIGDAATPYLADVLTDRNANARRLAANLLGEVCQEDTANDVRCLALGALLDRVGDPDPEVREHTTRSLQRIPAGTVVDHQLELLADPERSDRDEIRVFVMELLEHAAVEPGLRAAAVARIQGLGLAAGDPSSSMPE